MNESRRAVRVERNTLRFAAAHMATFAGQCEPLHGHNYDVTVEVEGELSDESWVIDFSLLKQLTRQVCQTLDHRFLLQRDSRVLHSEEHQGSWHIRFGEGPEYIFPADDVRALPIDNSTAERLSEWIHAQLVVGLHQEGITTIQHISVGVEEMPGQAAWYRAPATGV